MEITREQFAILENYDLKIQNLNSRINILGKEQEEYLKELIAPREIKDIAKVTNTEIIFKEEKVESTD